MCFLVSDDKLRKNLLYVYIYHRQLYENQNVISMAYSAFYEIALVSL